MRISRMLYLSLRGLLCVVFFAASPVAYAQESCSVPDNSSGTATLPAGCAYLAPLETMVIVDGLAPGDTIKCTPTWSDFSSIVLSSGGSLGGDSIEFHCTLSWVMQGTGTLSGFNRVLSFDLPEAGLEPVQIQTAPRAPGTPVQSFDTDMFRLFGQLPPGDPDFDLLRITAGTGFGMPSPGHTTLTRLPSGSWSVDSFFDITYRIDFVGHPGSSLGGHSGSTTATIRMQQGEPSTTCVPSDNGSGSVDLPAPCPYTDVPVATMNIIDGLAAGDSLKSDPTFDGFHNIVRTPGGTLSGEIEQYLKSLGLLIRGTGSYSTYTRAISLSNVQCEVHTAPRTPGSPIQSFDTDMFMMQGQITGDPDFDLLRITAGTGFGMPSPGHTTLTRMPGGTWNTDSFFDITYRIDFVGHPGGPFGGRSGSTTGTIRMQQGAPVDACDPPDNGSGTVDLPASCPYVDLPVATMNIINGLAAGDTIKSDPTHLDFTGISRTPGGPLGGEVETFMSSLMLVMSGTGTLATFSRPVTIPAQCEVHTAPRTPGTPVQSFDTDMFMLQGQITGDPDFDLLRITAGSGFGMPSPGHTTLTVAPGGTWHVDSFFDITYRIDFVGHPGGPLGGMSGSTTGTIRMQQGTPGAGCPAITLLPANLPNGIVGTTYNPLMSASGGTAPYTFGSAGSLPPGLSLATSGQWSGAPTTPGCYTFMVTVADANSCSGSQEYTMSVSAASGGAIFASNNLPPNTTYQSATASCDMAFESGNNVIRNIVLGSLSPTFPPPALGVTETHALDGQMSFDLSTDGGTTFNPMTAPATATVRVTCTLDGGPVSSFDTEMLQLDISGSGLPLGTMIRESPTKQSLGKTSITNGGGGQYRIGSFFDIFTELSVDGGSSWIRSVSSGALRIPQVDVTCSSLSISNLIVSVGIAFDQTFNGNGGAGPYTFSTSDPLPPGLALSAAGELSGIPTTAGCYVFDLVVTDNTGLSSLPQSVTLGVAEVETAIPFSSDNFPPASDYESVEGSCRTDFVPIEVLDLPIVNRSILKSRFIAMGPSTPPPALGVTEVQNLTGEVEIQMSTDGGTTFDVVTAPATMEVSITHSSDGSTSRFFDTEMLALNIAGGGLPLGTMIRESPTKQSLGKTSIINDGGGQFRIGSFFDIFTEISLDGGAQWSPATTPARVHLPVPTAPQLFLSVPPETLVVADIGDKFIKPVKRHKGLYPNWANLRDETIAQGGFQPGMSESDSAGGLRIGLSFMERKNPGDPAKPNWKPIKDSAKVHGWIRIGKWNFKKSIGASADAIPKTLRSKGSIFHTGPARGLDSTGNPGDLKRKMFVKEQKKLEPKKTSNKLFAELLALKLNIAMSALGKTPEGFGDLIFDRDGNFLDEMELVEVSAKVDTMMTRWPFYTSEQYDSAWSALYDINRAFDGPLDTLSWEADDDAEFPLGKLTVKGQVDIEDVPFLRLPSPFVPTRIAATSPETEPDVDFDDEEFDEEGGIPVAAKLYQNYPNPFNPSTTILFRLREPSLVTLRVYNLLGQEVATLVEGEELEEGLQEMEFMPSGLSSGVYFYQMRSEGIESGSHAVATNKLLLLK